LLGYFDNVFDVEDIAGAAFSGFGFWEKCFADIADIAMNIRTTIDFSATLKPTPNTIPILLK